jgi:transcriptional regulator with XRE-family HTH domain
MTQRARERSERTEVTKSRRLFHDADVSPLTGQSSTGPPAAVVNFSGMDTAGQRIRRARENRGWTQQDLADRLGISRASISQWESNLYRPGREAIRALVKVLGKSQDWLLEGVGPEYERLPERQPQSVDGLDVLALANCIAMVDDGLAQAGMRVDTARRARVVALLYRDSVRTGGPVDDTAFRQFMSLLRP